MKKVGVIGYPVSHSLSPRLHNYWLRQYTISASYEAIAVEPGTLQSFLRALPENNFTGINLTIPHKEEALKYIDDLDETAKRIGAVNTIIVKDGKLIGKNTDAYGFMQNLKSGTWNVTRGKALVIGAGGAARAVCIGLLDAGYEITLINRTREKAEILAASLNSATIKVLEWNTVESAMHDVSLLVNTTSLGMKGQPPLDISLHTLPQNALVTDIVYNPLMTPLLTQAKNRGNEVVDGLGMLLYQAQAAFNEWFGVLPEVSSGLRTHVLEGMK